MIDHRFSFRSLQLIDSFVGIKGVVVIVCGGNFFKDDAGFGPKGMPHTGQDKNGFAGMENAGVAVDVDVRGMRARVSQLSG